MNLGLLKRHSRWQSRDAGIREEFLQPRFGGSRTLAVLSSPLGETKPMAWVVCHSFGEEYMNLSRLNVMLARRLSAAGFAVLRFDGQGYGDSEGIAGGPSLRSHVSAASDAISFARELDGVESVGVVGVLFGATVAALAADECPVSAMALCKPVISGERYLGEMLRRPVLSSLTRSSAGSPVPDHTGIIRNEITADGRADLAGFPLTEDARTEISGIQLERDISRFHGESVLVPVMHGDRTDPETAALEARLVELGGRCTVAGVSHRKAGLLGRRAYVRGFDLTFDLSNAICERIAEWSCKI